MTTNTYPTLSSSLLRPPASMMAGASAPPSILHLGLGNFHRAHQAVYTAAANHTMGSDWSIVGVASRSQRTVDAMREQEMLYTVVEISPDGNQYSIPAVHTDAIVAADDASAVVDWIADPRISIVTLTVTEHAYQIDPSTGRLHRNPQVLADLTGTAAPLTTLGQLVRGLQQRMRNEAPITVLSCDNLAGNGNRLKAQVLEFCESMAGAESARVADWIEDRVTFPCSMVDRIVPTTQPAHIRAVQTDCGYIDRIPVPAEPFTMWALEDNFAAGRPQWESCGAIFTNEVERYEDMKLRLLNGTHSLLAYAGVLSGHRTIPDAVANEQIRIAAHRILRSEYLPSVQMPAEVTVDAYEGQLLQRWQNRALGHQTSQVGSDGSVKLPQRIVEPSLLLLRQGRTPHYLALTVAAYLSCVAPLEGFDPGRFAAQISDPATPRLRELASRSQSGQSLASAVFHDAGLFPEELAEEQQFTDRVGELIDVIRTDGIAQALTDIDAGYPDPDPIPSHSPPSTR